MKFWTTWQLKNSCHRVMFLFQRISEYASSLFLTYPCSKKSENIWHLTFVCIRNIFWTEQNRRNQCVFFLIIVWRWIYSFYDDDVLLFKLMIHHAIPHQRRWDCFWFRFTAIRFEKYEAPVPDGIAAKVALKKNKAWWFADNIAVTWICVKIVYPVPLHHHFPYSTCPFEWYIGFFGHTLANPKSHCWYSIPQHIRVYPHDWRNTYHTLW